MTVGDLINWLQGYDEDMEIVTQASNSMYVDGVAGVEQMELRSFWGEDRDVLVITSDGQLGAV